MLAAHVQAQQADAAFFAPITIACLVVCGLWLGLDRLAPALWPKPAIPSSERPGLDLALACAAVVAIFGIGQLWRAGFLLPEPEGLRALTHPLNTLLIYAPIAVVLAVRRQPPTTVLVSRRGLATKATVGLLLGLAGTALYLALRGEIARFGDVLARTLTPAALMHAPAVFLEAVAVAFVWVRLRWICGGLIALLIPCLLFAAGHVPRQLDGGRTAGEIAAFFALNTMLPLAIFATVVRARDVVWIGIVHYLLDAAIDAY